MGEALITRRGGETINEVTKTRKMGSWYELIARTPFDREPNFGIGASLDYMQINEDESIYMFVSRYNQNYSSRRLFYSTDNCNSYKQVTDTFADDICFFKYYGGYFYVVCGDGDYKYIYRSTNGETWEQILGKSSSTCVYFSGGRVGYTNSTESTYYSMPADSSTVNFTSTSVPISNNTLIVSDGGLIVYRNITTAYYSNDGGATFIEGKKGVNIDYKYAYNSKTNTWYTFSYNSTSHVINNQHISNDNWGNWNNIATEIDLDNIVGFNGTYKFYCDSSYYGSSYNSSSSDTDIDGYFYIDVSYNNMHKGFIKTTNFVDFEFVEVDTSLYTISTYGLYYHEPTHKMYFNINQPSWSNTRAGTYFLAVSYDYDYTETDNIPNEELYIRSYSSEYTGVGKIVSSSNNDLASTNLLTLDFNFTPKKIIINDKIYNRLNGEYISGDTAAWSCNFLIFGHNKIQFFTNHDTNNEINVSGELYQYTII